MKFLALALTIAALCYVPALAQDEAPEEVAEAEAEGNTGVEELEAELSELGIEASIVQLPTLPQDIDNSVPWECIPRMWYRNSCNVCKCTRRRQLRCVRRSCDK